MPILRPHAARFHKRLISSVKFTLAHFYSNVTLHAGGRGSRAGRFVRFWATGKAQFTKIYDSLPWTPMNRRAKCDAASFILGGEISNRTNTHKNTNKQTVNDIPTPCLLASVDNMALYRWYKAGYCHPLEPRRRRRMLSRLN